jgi:hypothetical protein
VAVALIHSNFGHSVFLVQLYDKKRAHLHVMVPLIALSQQRKAGDVTLGAIRHSAIGNGDLHRGQSDPHCHGNCRN